MALFSKGKEVNESDAAPDMMIVSAVKCQRWECSEDASLVCDGMRMVSLACKFMGLSDFRAFHHLYNSKVGEAFNTGVSAYIRIA